MGVAELNVNLKLTDLTSKALDKLKTKLDGVSTKVQGNFAKIQGGFAKARASVNGFAQSFKNNWLAITAAITASIFAIRTAFQFVETAAKFEQQQEAFANLSASLGADAESIITHLKKMSGQTLSTAEVMQNASKAMVLGLAPESLPKLMEISRAAARAFGEDVGFMFDSIVLGIGRQSRMILDNLGIIVKAEDAYKQYAVTLGKSVKELTDMEKRQAFTNAVMLAGEKIIEQINAQNKTQLESLQSLSAAWEDMRIKIGDFLLLAIQGLSLLANVLEIGIFQGLETITAGIANLSETMANFVVGLQTMANKIPKVSLDFSGLAMALHNVSVQNKTLSAGFQNNADEFKNAATQISSIISQKLDPSISKINTSLKKMTTDTSNAVTTATKSTFDGMSESLNALGSAFAGAEVLGKGFAKAAAAVAMAMAIINTAEGVTRALKDYPFPFNLVVGGIVAAAGAIQIATIAAQSFHSGGMIRAHDGLAVDEVPIIAQTGEGILSRRGMSALGGSGILNELNQGRSFGGGGGGEITVNVYYPRMSSSSEVKTLAKGLGFELEKQMRYAGSS